MIGKAEKIPVSQARPAMITSAPVRKARWKASTPICPTM
jgi:hypothetical protein